MRIDITLHRRSTLLAVASALLFAPARLDCHEWRVKPQLRSHVQKFQQSDGGWLLSELCEEITTTSVTDAGMTCKLRSSSRFTDMHGYEFYPEGVLFGRCLSPTSEDAVVSGLSAETNPARWGGTLLLTRRDGRWIPLSYKSRVITHSCEKLGLPNGRDVLLCKDEDGGMGHWLHFLYLIDFTNPKESREIRLVTADSVGWLPDSCVVRRQNIEKVDWQPESLMLVVTLATPVWKREAENPCAVDPGPAPRSPLIQKLRFKFAETGFVAQPHTR